MKIVHSTTCKGRINHLKQTLPKNLKDRGGNGAVFVVLDYNDQDGLAEYIQHEHSADLDAGTLVYYQNKDEPKFRMAHAKNQAHRCALAEGADVLVTLDADNLTGPGFASFVSYKFEADPGLSFLAPDFRSLPKPGHRFDPNNPIRLGRGFAGRLAIRANDFVKAGGYNEIFETWRGEDIDLIARLGRLGLKRDAIERAFLNAIAHSSDVRFREYPNAKRFEDEDVFATSENAHDTVVNNGFFGCGEVYRNFETQPISLPELPTRVFGIGMQRTGTTSLHEAFRLLGLDSAHWKSAAWAQAIWREINRWGSSRTLERYYALCDNPIPLLYEKLDKAYPGSKFILTVRDEDAWLKSIAHCWSGANPHRWTWEGDGFTHKMHAMLYGVVEFDPEIFRARYRKHNEDVRRYFHGRHDFMEIEVNENAGMADLCRFLGLPVMNASFPHRHKSADHLRLQPTQESNDDPRSDNP